MKRGFRVFGVAVVIAAGVAGLWSLALAQPVANEVVHHAESPGHAPLEALSNAHRRLS